MTATQQAIPITPAPRCGQPFRIHGCDDHLWFNETLRYRNNRKVPLELFKWRCPFGKDGEPRLIDGVWHWVKTTSGQDVKK